MEPAVTRRLFALCAWSVGPWVVACGDHGAPSEDVVVEDGVTVEAGADADAGTDADADADADGEEARDDGGEDSLPETGVRVPRLALRVPDLEVLAFFEEYRDGTRGALQFLYYTNIELLEQIADAGVTLGDNPAELAALMPCDGSAAATVESSTARYLAAGVSFVTLDCERGTDHVWSVPDVEAIAAGLGAVRDRDASWLHLAVAMQYGYLEFTGDGAGHDVGVCTRPRDPSTCDFDASLAAAVWRVGAQGDALAIFGESEVQRTPDEFEANNADWRAFAGGAFPERPYWAITGLTDKDGDGSVDIEPSVAADIAVRAGELGASVVGVVYLGRAVSEIVDADTGMDAFLDSLAAR
jgi:hypothetical protein